MKIIVTGASGFIGGHLVKRLNAINLDCVGVARRACSDYMTVGQYVDTPLGDVLIHAAEISDRSSANQAGESYQMQTIHTLDALLAKRFKHVIYLSSGVLYGDSSSEPHKETGFVEKIDTYTNVKFSSEKLVLSDGGTVLRLANIYGNGMGRTNIFSDIINQLPKKSPVILRDSSPIRDFLFIDDTIDAILSLLNTKATGIFNISSSTGVSIAELARTLLTLAGQPRREILSLNPTKNKSCLVLDNSKAKTFLNWKPANSLETGLSSILGKHSA